jgi:DNA-binding transcriptional MerR regulator
MQQSEQHYEYLRDTIKQLFKDAGYEIPELLEALDRQEKSSLDDQRVEALTAENERLKQEINRLRTKIYDLTVNNMSSKLKDALRE